MIVAKKIMQCSKKLHAEGENPPVKSVIICYRGPGFSFRETHGAADNFSTFWRGLRNFLACWLRESAGAIRANRLSCSPFAHSQ